jgi:hypothetical protein
VNYVDTLWDAICRHIFVKSALLALRHGHFLLWEHLDRRLGLLHSGEKPLLKAIIRNALKGGFVDLARDCIDRLKGEVEDRFDYECIRLFPKYMHHPQAKSFLRAIVKTPVEFWSDDIEKLVRDCDMDLSSYRDLFEPLMTPYAWKRMHDEFIGRHTARAIQKGDLTFIAQRDILDDEEEEENEKHMYMTLAATDDQLGVLQYGYENWTFDDITYTLSNCLHVAAQFQSVTAMEWIQNILSNVECEPGFAILGLNHSADEKISDDRFWAAYHHLLQRLPKDSLPNGYALFLAFTVGRPNLFMRMLERGMVPTGREDVLAVTKALIHAKNIPLLQAFIEKVPLDGFEDLLEYAVEEDALESYIVLYQVCRPLQPALAKRLLRVAANRRSVSMFRHLLATNNYSSDDDAHTSLLQSLLDEMMLHFVHREDVGVLDMLHCLVEHCSSLSLTKAYENSAQRRQYGFLYEQKETYVRAERIILFGLVKKDLSFICKFI